VSGKRRDPRLEKLRRAIDSVDVKLLALLSKRGLLVERVGRHKKKSGMSFHRPGREREVLAALASRNAGPYPDESVEAIWREILSASLALEAPLTIAVAGGPAEALARRRFGSAARLRGEAGPAEAVEAVSRGWASYGVVRVEDAASGFDGPALDALAEGEVAVTGEIVAPHGGIIVRALVVGGDDPPPTGEDQTSVLLAPPDEPGAVARMLAAFGKRGVNLRRIEARPAGSGRRRRWAYRFFVDLEGHRADAPLARALKDLTAAGAAVRVLGSYPRAR
jgi:chorismate mutase-like protein